MRGIRLPHIMIMASLFFLGAVIFVSCSNEDDDDSQTEPSTNTTTSTSEAGTPTVSNLSIAEGNRQLTITWDEVSNATYKLRYQKIEPNAQYTNVPAEGDDNLTEETHTISSLTNGVEYQVQVLWVSSNDVLSPWASATGRPFVLATPTDLATVIGDQQIRLEWGEVSTATKYELRYKEASQDDDEFLEIVEGTEELAATNFLLPMLSNGTNYVFQVRAVNTHQQPSDWSTNGMGTPLELTTPTNFMVASRESGELSVSWDLVTSATRYELRHTTNNSDYTDITNHNNAPIVSSPFVITGLVDGTPYTVQVRSRNDLDQASDWSTSDMGTPVDELIPPAMELVEDTGDADDDFFTTNASVQITSRPGATVTLSMSVDTAPHVFSGNANVISVGPTGRANVDLATLASLSAPTGNAVTVLSVTGIAAEGGQTSEASEAMTFTLVSGPPPQADVDGITLGLETNTGDTSDSVTTARYFSLTGMVPDGMMLTFVITTNGEMHSPSFSITWTGQTNLSLMGQNFGIPPRPTELLEVSLTAKMTRHAHSVTGDAFEYTLIPWPPTVTATYTDDGSSVSDGFTSDPEVTFGGMDEFDATDIKVVSFVVTNTADDDTDDAVTVDQALDSSYEVDMGAVKPFLSDDEKILTLTLDYKGHTVDYTFDPPMQYTLLFRYDRQFSTPDAPFAIAINGDNVLLVTVVGDHKVYFYNTDGTATNINIGGDAEAAAMSIGSQGNANSQFRGPRGIVVGSGGKVYVADSLNNRIQVFDSNFTHEANITHGTVRPTAMALYDGHLYVTVGGSSSGIEIYAESGLNSVRSRSGTFNSGTVDNNGVLHASDWSGKQVRAYTGSPADGFSSTSRRFSTSPGTPRGIAVGPTSGRLYVSDDIRHRILVLQYDSSAESDHYTLLGFLGKTDGSADDGNGEFDNPQHMLIHGGKLYVADYDNNRVQVFDVPE